MDINYKKIAECIADEVMPLEEEMAVMQERALLALKILDDNGLIDEYRRKRRKKIVQGIIIKDG